MKEGSKNELSQKVCRRKEKEGNKRALGLNHKKGGRDGLLVWLTFIVYAFRTVWNIYKYTI